MLNKKNINLKNRKNVAFVLICIAMFIFVVTFAVYASFALFSDKQDYSINIRPIGDDVHTALSLDIDRSMVQSDVVKVFTFSPSSEIPSAKLFKSATVSIKQNDDAVVCVRFSAGFEYIGEQNVENERLQTVLSYLNLGIANDLELSVSSSPYGSCRWVFNEDSGYYELLNTDNTMAEIDLYYGDAQIDIFSSAIEYFGFSKLNINLSSLTDAQMKTLQNLSFVINVEAVKSGEQFESGASKRTYGNVAVFSSNGGEEVEAILANGQNKISLPSTVKAANTFKGWYLEEENLTFVGTSGTVIEQNELVSTYYAGFDAIAYTVTLDTNGGVLYGSTSEHVIQNVLYGKAFLQVPALTTKNGYNFLGYYDKDDVCYIDKDGVAVRNYDKQESSVLTAKYSDPIKYSIVYLNVDFETSFNVNPPASYTYGLSTSIPKPHKAGFTFLGWKINGSEQVVENYSTDANLTYGDLYLSATWLANEYSYTYLEDSGQVQKTYTFETGVILPAVSTSFAGYKVSAVSGDTNWEVGEIYASNIAITGRYGDVEFTLAPASDIISFNGNTVDEYIVDPAAIGASATSIVVLPNAYRTGYKFVGWYFDAECTRECPRHYQISRADFENDKNLYAKWEEGEPKYNVLLENGEGLADFATTFVLNAQNKTTFDISPRVNVPYKMGYTFMGYYTKPNAEGVKFYSEQGYNLLDTFSNEYLTSYSYNFTLYASFKQHVYTLNFDSRGGGEIAPLHYTSGAQDLMFPHTSKAGYTFTGWKIMTQDGNWTVNEVLDLADGIDVSEKWGNATLWAQYQIKQYNINLNYIDRVDGSFTALNEKIEYTYLTESVTLPQKTLVGHKFLGWQVVAGSYSWQLGRIYSGDELEIILNSSYIGDVEFKALYEVVTYSITFKYTLDGVEQTGEQFENATKTTFFTYRNDSVTMLKLLDNLGYTYTNWSPEVTSGAWVKGEEYASLEEVTLTDEHYTNVTLVSNVIKFFEDGDGTKLNPFKIKNQTQLQNMSDMMKTYRDYERYKSSCYELMADITLTGSIVGSEVEINSNTYTANFTSIGSEQNAFLGIFDGKGFTIENMVTTASKNASVGLFASTLGATIRNVNLKNAKAYSTFDVCGLLVSVSDKNTSISNCVITGDSYILTTASAVGGIVGQAKATAIRDISVNATIEGKGYLGGIAGKLVQNSIAINLSFSGKVEACDDSTISGVGGIVGVLGSIDRNSSNLWGSSVVINALNSGEVTIKEGSTSSSAVGGVLGYKGYASHAFNLLSTGKVLSRGVAAGGGVVGTSYNLEQDDTYTSLNGLKNWFYVENSNEHINLSGNSNFVNEKTSANYYISNDLIENRSWIKTDYSIASSNSFASIATLLNTWIIDLKKQTSLKAPIHYDYMVEQGTTYNTLFEYLDIFGYNDFDLNLWTQNGSEISLLTQTGQTNSSFIYKFIDASGGLMQGQTSRIYGKVSVGAQQVYLDSEIVKLLSFVKSGYSFVGLNSFKDGLGTSIEIVEDNVNGDYFVIEVSDYLHQGNETFYAIWKQTFAEGNGTEANPYIISSAEHLIALSRLVATNEDNGYYASAFYHQPIDIHLEESDEFTPIGNSEFAFKGFYYGYNKTIYGLHLSSEYSSLNQNDYVGVFGYIQGATIKALNISLTGSIYGQNNVGLLAGYAKNAIIYNVGVKCDSVVGKENVGAIVGFSEQSTIRNCSVDANCYGEQSVGVLVGNLSASSVLENCFVYAGDVSASVNYAGTIVGVLSASKILNVASLASINNSSQTSSSFSVAGLVMDSDNCQVNYIYTRCNSSLFSDSANIDVITKATIQNSSTLLTSNCQVNVYLASSVFEAMALYVMYVAEQISNLCYYTLDGSTRYAQTYMEEEVCLVFNINCAQSFTSEDNVSVKYLRGQTTFVCPTVTCEGKTFMGWYTSSGEQIVSASGEIKQGFTLDSSIILHAQWS